MPCDRTHLKKALCHTCPLVGRRTNTQPRHISVGRVSRHKDLIWCVLTRLAVSWDTPWPASASLKGQSSQALTLRRGVRFIARRLRHPALGECRRGRKVFLEPPGLSELRSCARTHLKKASCHTRSSGRARDNYPAMTHFGWSCWSTHGSDQVCPGSAGSQSRCNLTGILEPQGAVPPGSNPPWMG